MGRVFFRDVQQHNYGGSDLKTVVVASLTGEKAKWMLKEMLPGLLIGKEKNLNSLLWRI